MKPVSFSRRSVVITWLLSYLTVLLLPLIISVFVYIVASRTLESEIHEANSSLLKQVREMMDNYFQAMERLNYELTWNVRVQELLYSNKYLSSPKDFNYDLYQISQDMKPFQSAYSLVDMFYIHLNKSDTVIMPSLVREGEYAYDLLHQSKELSYDKWIATLDQKDYRGFIPLNRIDDTGKLRKTVALVSAYTMNKSESPATNVIMVDQDRILSSIQNMELFNKGHVFILNEENKVLVSNSNDALTAGVPFERLTDPHDPQLYWSNEGRNYEVLTLGSERSGMKYVSLIPSNLFWEKATLVRNLTIASSLVSLLGGVLLTMFFLRRNYNPVRNLMMAFSGKSEVPFHRGGNEFQQLQQALDRTFSKLDSMTSQMERQRLLVRSHFITRLLKGRADSTVPIEESLATFHMTFASDDFAVILLYTEQSDAFYERLSGMEDVEKQKLMQFIVTNVIEEMASQHNIGYVAETDDVLACLINFKQTENRKEELRRIAVETQRFLAGAYGIQLTMAISAIHRTTAGIPQAYLEALDAMEYKLVLGKREILAYEELYAGAKEDGELGYYYPLQVEQQLINYVKVGDFEKAKRTLDDIIEHNFHGGPVSVPFARCLMLNLVSTMIKTVSDTGSLQESFLVQNPKRIEKLTQCDTVQEMQRQMTDFLRQVCDYTAGKRQQNLQQTRQQALDELVGRIQALIHERYQDPNLNISTIGHHFDMKPTYLSKQYKDFTGEGLLDYINKTRVGIAKTLIAEKNKNVSDVAACVGFGDVNAFIRTFKKYEGVTPGKFKEAVMEMSS